MAWWHRLDFRPWRTIRALEEQVASQQAAGLRLVQNNHDLFYAHAEAEARLDAANAEIKALRAQLGDALRTDVAL